MIIIIVIVIITSCFLYPVYQPPDPPHLPPAKSLRRRSSPLPSDGMLCAEEDHQLYHPKLGVPQLWKLPGSRISTLNFMDFFLN